MKTLSKLIAVACVASMILMCAGNSVQAAGQLKKPKLSRSLQHFTKINVEGNVRLVISNSANDQLTFLSKEDLISKKIKIEVKNRELMIHSTVSESAETPTILLFASDLQLIEACNNAHIESLADFTAPELSISLDNESTANLNLDVFELYSQVSLGSMLVVKGSAYTHTIRTDKSACIDGSSFIVNNYNADLNGNCDFKAIVKDKFNYKNGSPSKMNLDGDVVSITTNVIH